MDTIPEQFKQIAESSDLYDEVMALGNKFDLHIDQIGALDAEIRDVLRGAAKPNEFAKDITESMEIDPTLARKITEAVNTDILQKIRKDMQDKTPDTSVSSLEQLGGFQVEHEKTAEDDIDHVPTDVSAADKTDILSGIENPTEMERVEMPQRGDVTDGPEEAHTEPLIDHLLANSMAEPQKVVERKVNLMEEDTPPARANPVPASNPEPTPKPDTQPPKPPEKPKGNDPYREATK